MTLTELAKALDKEEMDKEGCEMDDEAFIDKFGSENDIL